jgi:hypothetical protein
MLSGPYTSIKPSPFKIDTSYYDLGLYMYSNRYSSRRTGPIIGRISSGKMLG